MPEYYIPMGSHEASDTWAELDDFTRGYIEAAFFTSASCADDGEPENATFAEIAPSSLAAIMAECATFQAKYGPAIDAASGSHRRGRVYDHEAAGRDFWYTRNGHGVGYWDREPLSDLQSRGLAVLDEAARRYRGVDLYRGNDGLIYFD